MKLNRIQLFFCIAYFIVFSLLATACTETYVPKPYGYYRIDFPEKSYRMLEGNFPYRFETATHSYVEADRAPDAEPYWINIVYPSYNAIINLSYKPILTDTSLQTLLQDCHRLAYAHTLKAESINEQFFQKENGTFGLLYIIEGNAASPAQFFITDSLKHFLRGSLYFKEHPNKDSLAPVIHYLRKDIVKLMETVEFKP